MMVNVTGRSCGHAEAAAWARALEAAAQARLNAMLPEVGMSSAGAGAAAPLLLGALLLLLPIRSFPFTLLASSAALLVALPCWVPVGTAMRMAR